MTHIQSVIPYKKKRQKDINFIGVNVDAVPWPLSTAVNCHAFVESFMRETIKRFAIYDKTVFACACERFFTIRHKL